MTKSSYPTNDFKTEAGSRQDKGKSRGGGWGGISLLHPLESQRLAKAQLIKSFLHRHLAPVLKC